MQSGELSLLLDVLLNWNLMSAPAKLFCQNLFDNTAKHCILEF